METPLVVLFGIHSMSLDTGYCRVLSYFLQQETKRGAKLCRKMSLGN